MKYLYFLAAILGTVILYGADSDIRLNSLGFRPRQPKKVAITAPCAEFFVKRTRDEKVQAHGKVTGPRHQDDVRIDVWTADFSKLSKPGTYFIEIPGVGRSIDFRIAEDVYDFPLVTVMRGFYLLRCGTAVRGEHQGSVFSHGPCHMEDGLLTYVGPDSSFRDGTGGWHDAGDYGKYVVNANVTVGALLLAWEHFREKLSLLKFDLPETASGLPEYLKEVKWETDWLLKMSLPDGSGKVSHKLTSTGFCGFIMPEDDRDDRFFVDWSTEATADFAAMLAMASGSFRPYLPAYADTCLAEARKSYAFLKSHPEEKRADQHGFRTGFYPSKDMDDRLWAAAELWKATQEPEYLNDFEMMACREKNKIDLTFDWGDVKNLGMFTYLMSKSKERNDSLIQIIGRDLVFMADSLSALGQRDVFGRTLGRKYWWGCNGALARQTLILYMANRVSPDRKYIDAAVDITDHLFGRNIYGRSYVTGLGHLPPLNPHDRRSGGDGIKPPWPGYLVGGGESATDWHDEEKDFRTNEICINWQAALVYALAWISELE